MVGHLVAFEYPSIRLPGFGLGDLLTDPWDVELFRPRSSTHRPWPLDDLVLRHAHRRCPSGRIHHRKNLKSPATKNDDGEVEKDFRVSLDVNHFQPEELSVKTTGDRVVIHGRQEEKEDEDGYIMREFKRTYLLPEDVDPDTIKSSLSGNGILSIQAQRKPSMIEAPPEKTIPIERVEVEKTTNEGQPQSSSECP